MCRWSDSAFPEPAEYVPQQIHLTPAGARPEPSAHPSYSGITVTVHMGSQVARVQRMCPLAQPSVMLSTSSAFAAPHGCLCIGKATPCCAMSVDHAPPSTIRALIVLCLLAATDFTSVSITWVTGHVTETLPDIPYTATSVYNVNPLNVSKPSAV